MEDFELVKKVKSITGINTGDETQSTIQNKLGISSSTKDGYLTSIDWNIFNNKQNKIFIQNTQPAIAIDNIWIDNSKNPYNLMVCDGTSYIQVGDSSSTPVSNPQEPKESLATTNGQSTFEVINHTVGSKYLMVLVDGIRISYSDYTDIDTTHIQLNSDIASTVKLNTVITSFSTVIETMIVNSSVLNGGEF